MDFEQQLSLMVPRLLEHKPKRSNGLPFAVGGFFLGVFVTLIAVFAVTFDTPPTIVQNEPVERTMYVLNESVLSSAKRTGDAMRLTKMITVKNTVTNTTPNDSSISTLLQRNTLSYYEL